MALVHHEEIVEIAAHFLGRIHGGKNIELRPIGEGRKHTGQHGSLDLLGNIQLRTDSLLLCRHRLQLVDIGPDVGIHLLESFKQFLDLIAGFNGNLEGFFVLQILNHGSGNTADLVDGIDDLSFDKEEAHPDGQHNHQNDGDNNHRQEVRHVLLQVGHVHIDAHHGNGLTLAVKDRRIGRSDVAVGIVIDQLDLFGGIVLVDGIGGFLAAFHVLLVITQLTGTFLQVGVPDVDQVILKGYEDIVILNVGIGLEGIQEIQHLIVVLVLVFRFQIVGDGIAVDQFRRRLGVGVGGGSAVFHFLVHILGAHHQADDENQNQGQHRKAEQYRILELMLFTHLICPFR